LSADGQEVTRGEARPGLVASHPQIGDVFAVRGRGVLGRVITVSAVVGPTHGCVLVYLYRDDSLARDALLVPPLLTTRAPWSHGAFEHLRSEPLMPGQYFEHHAFRDHRGVLLDEEGRPTKQSDGPVGECRLVEVEAIDAMIAKALG
jgi:hypothetical protein